MVKIDDLIMKVEDASEMHGIVFTAPERDTIIDALILYKEMN